MKTQLRTRFENYLTLQRLSDRTIESYLQAIKGIAAYYGKSPDSLSEQEIQTYLLYLLRTRSELEFLQCSTFRPASLLREISQTQILRILAATPPPATKTPRSVEP